MRLHTLHSARAMGSEQCPALCARASPIDAGFVDAPKSRGGFDIKQARIRNTSKMDTGFDAITHPVCCHPSAMSAGYGRWMSVMRAMGTRTEWGTRGPTPGGERGRTGPECHHVASLA